MKRNRINRDRRLLEALDYLDESYIADVVDNLRLPPAPGVPLPKKGRILRSLKPVAILVACALLLGALIPAVTYMTSHIPDIVAFFRGDQTEATVPDETDPYDPTETTAPPETTEPIKHEHNGSEGLVYRVNDDGASVTLISSGTCEELLVNIASTYDGLPVTAIGDGAFTAAECKTVTIPSSVISIGVGAFASCTNLVSVKIPNSVTAIGANAFEGCISLTRIYLPDSLTVIPTGMFSGCEKLKHVTIKKTLKRIIMGAFIGCQNLTGIEFVGSKSEWNRIQKGDYWNMQSAIKQVDTNGGTVFVSPSPSGAPDHNGSEGLEYKLNGAEATLSSLGTCADTDVVIATTYKGYPVKWIAIGVFDGYSQMESISIPETIVSIGERAFADCNKLKSLSLGPSVIGIHHDAFRGCSSLDSFEIDPDNPYFTARNNCVIEKSTSKLILACNTATIPSDANIKTISSYAFSGLEGITEIAIPEGVTRVMANAINDCVNLRKISLPSTLTNLDLNFLSGRESVDTILFPNGHPTYTAEGNAISDKNSKTLLRGFSNTTIPDWVTSINSEAFKGCTSLERISIPAGVTLMPAAFQGCTALRVVEFEGDVKLNGAYIFAECTSLESIVIPENVTSIPSYTFTGCSKLSKIVLHNKITSLSEYAFSDCKALSSINIPISVRELSDFLFYGSNSLREIIYEGTRHEWYTVKKGYSWKGGTLTLATVRCTDGDLALTESQPQAGSYGLLYRVNPDGQSAEFIGFKEGVLNSFEIASSYNGLPVTGFADGALSKIASSGKIILSSNIEKIEEGLFAQSPYVSHIEIRPNVKGIEKDAFIGCLGLKELTYRGTVKAWEQVKKDDRWNYGTAIEVVHCIDGDVSVTPHQDTNNGSAGLTYRIAQNSSGDFYAVFTGLGTCTDTDIVIASDYFGYPVLELQNSIGADNNTVRSVTLPDSITVIPYAFFRRCMALERVIIPDSVKAIDLYAFSDCISLKEIKLPKSLEIIEQNAFSGCVSIEKVDLPDSLLEIGSYAFRNCTLLKKIAIPEGVTFIGLRSFEGTLIDSIHIPKNVIDMGVDLGYNIKNITIDPENPVYVITGNCLIDRERRILLKVFGEPEFPNDGSIRYIDDSAFNGIDFEIKKLILPEGLEEFGWYLSEKLTELEELHIPSTFVDWNGSTFEYCANLKKVTVAEGNPRYYSAGNCVIDRDIGELVLGCNTSVIPNDGSVKSIGTYAFKNRGGLDSIVIPEGVVEIGHGAFMGCSSLREVKLPDSLEKISESAFSHCSALEEIEFGANVNMINLHAFAYCTSLKEVVLPDNLYENCLGWDLFRNCTALEKVYVPHNVKYINFSGCTNLREIVYGGTIEEWNAITIYDDDFHGTALERITCTDGVITEIPYETEMPVY